MINHKTGKQELLLLSHFFVAFSPSNANPLSYTHTQIALDTKITNISIKLVNIFVKVL